MARSGSGAVIVGYLVSWLGTDDRRKKDPEAFQTVSDGLKKLYKTKLLPLEEYYKFHEFHSPALKRYLSVHVFE